ncbi:MAG: hypothetical protein K0S33_1606 [Bacteroidetes bacterium]|jgi:hypothetical protein|nr:hypothetical protein [Bacteroidota bacterium]
MKKLLFVVLIVFTLTTAFGQTSPASLQWERSQNGVASTSNAFIKTKNDIGGNIYALSYSDEDMLVVKFNSATQVVQSYRYNNPGNANDYPKDFDVDASGNVYMSGFSFMNSQYRMTVVKFNAGGTLLWELNYLPGNYWVYPTEISANAMCLDNSGNVYFTGAINDSLVAVKVSAAGAVQWATKISNSGNYFGSGNDIAVDAFNSVYIAGKSKNGAGNFDAVAVKLNASGVQQWIKAINGSAANDDYSVNVGVDNSSNVYVSSMIADTSAGNFSNYLTKYNASGAQQWQKRFHVTGQMNSTAVKLIVDNLGNNYLGIHVNQSSAIGYARIYKHSAGGTPFYNVTIDESTENDNNLTDIYVDANANLYTTGRFQGTGKLFFNKLNSTGTPVLNGQFNHGGANNLYDNAGIIAEQSGFFNIVTTAAQVYNARFNNSGVFLYEGVFAGNGNTADRAVKVIAQGSNSVYGLGNVTNDNSGIDAVISKYDSEGNILWQNILDNNLSNDQAFDMSKDSVFNIYITKNTGIGSEVIKYDSIGSPVWTYPNPYIYKKILVADGANSFVVSDEGPFGRGYQSFNVARLDVNGSLIFQSTPVNDMAYQLYLGSMNIDDNQRIIAAGTRSYHSGQSDQKMAVIVEKFSNTGSMLWHKQVQLIDSTSNDAINYTNVKRVLVDDNNDIYICGTTTTNAGFGHSAMFIDKFNGNGTLQWHQLYDNSGAWHEYSADMRFLSNGQIIALSANPGSQIVKKINPNNGAVIWENPIYTGPASEGACLRIDDNDDIYFIGQGITGNSLRDIVLGKMGSGGNLQWIVSKAGSAVENDFAEHLDVTSNGRVYVAASMANNSGSSKDFSILKFCDISQPSLVTVGQTQGLCSGSAVTMSATGGTSYLWSDLSTANDTLIANASGDYFCTVYKNDGCFKNSDTVNVQFKTPPPTPQICAVTVDTLSTHNIIAWDKSGITGATAFNIYREDVTNIYSYIGTVVYDSLSEFHDNGANPNVTTKRYKITAIDSCGQESSMSNYHNTIYIVSNGSGQFSWNPIYTIENTPNPVTQYLLMRDDNNTGAWNQVASTAGTQFIVNDPDYALYPNGRWRVETAWNITCIPTRGAINTSRSNIKSPSSAIGLNETGGIADFSMSPNPANSQLTIRTGRQIGKTDLTIYNTLGQKVMMVALESLETTLNIENLEAGTYFVELSGDQKPVMKKLIKY